MKLQQERMTEGEISNQDELGGPALCCLEAVSRPRPRAATPASATLLQRLFAAPRLPPCESAAFSCAVRATCSRSTRRRAYVENKADVAGQRGPIDSRWLAEAWSSLSHELEASAEPPGRSLCRLVSSIAVRLLRCGRLLRCRRGVGHLGVLAVEASAAAAPRAKRLLDLDRRRLSARPYARRSVSSRSVSVLVLPCTSFLWVGFVCRNPI